MQVDPIKLTVKAPGNKRLKLKYDEVLSNSAFKLNLRRYIAVTSFGSGNIDTAIVTTSGQGLTLVPISAQLELFCPPYKPT